ncbi:hypothetical protein D3C77_696470 [compost metagenome]
MRVKRFRFQGAHILAINLWMSKWRRSILKASVGLFNFLLWIEAAIHHYAIRERKRRHYDVLAPVVLLSTYLCGIHRDTHVYTSIH